MLDLQFERGVFNDVYLPYLRDESRILIFYGGGGSGKSYFIAQRLVIRLISEVKRNALVLREDEKYNGVSTFPLLRQVISRWNLGAYFTVTVSPMRIICRLNCNEIRFAGLNDPEKIKSVTFAKGILTDIWVEEASEIAESAFNQLLIRLRGSEKANKQIVLSFNPIVANHWLKRRFFDNDNGAAILKTTYKDNRFLTREDCEQLESFKESDPYYYGVYCLGEWGVYGETVFDKAKVAERLSVIGQLVNYNTGYFLYEENAYGIVGGTVKFFADSCDYISIYREPEPGVSYVIGADTAGEGSDFFSAQVVNESTGEQCAVLHMKTDADLFVRQLYCLGGYYNNALVAVEKNFDMYPIRELERLGYNNQYATETIDDYTHKIQTQFGFRTDAKSRNTIVSGLIRFVRENCELIHDKLTLNEMITFVRNQKGRPEAKSGAHDDLIMALAIAHFVTDKAEFPETPEEVKPTFSAYWRHDIYEDYRNADKAGRAAITAKFGSPINYRL
jgi:phage terminase large subunit